MEKIKVLQLGTTDWSQNYRMPEMAVWDHREMFHKAPKKPYDLVFLDRAVQKEEIKPLMQAVLPYTLFISSTVEWDSHTEYLAKCKKAKILEEDQIETFLLEELRFFYRKPYGERFRNTNLAVAVDFQGDIQWHGGCYLSLNGEFGEKMSQVAFWRNNIPLFKGLYLDLWLEYEKDPEVEIELHIIQFVSGGSDVLQKWTFSEEELEDVVTIGNEIVNGYIFVSLFAKGKGNLKIRTLHDRYSRKGHGHFLPGGERHVTSHREEFFSYFDPGDLKPPLCVYFSGYRQQEGFEGRNMMRRMNCPFLLMTDPRMEGGNYYMGSEEFETLLVRTIRGHMRELGFDSDQLIVSGISMGSIGSMYYGSDLEPHALILGKPVGNLGDIAANEKLVRPGVFPAALDVLMNVCGEADPSRVDQFNHRFWDKFDYADWSRTKIILSYLLEDDYDKNTYQMIISRLQSGGVQVYGKGIHGRHGDNTEYVVEWFISQYKKILREDFGREI